MSGHGAPTFLDLLRGDEVTIVDRLEWEGDAERIRDNANRRLVPGAQLSAGAARQHERHQFT